MFDLSWFITKTITEPLTPSVALAYYEVAEVEIEKEVEVKVNPIACSCVKSARLVFSTLPRGDARDFKPNTTMDKGDIAILDYNGVRHLTVYKPSPMGLITRSEGNYRRCEIVSRVIPWEEVNEHLIGFYKVPTDALHGSP